jgi:hypothetical protein
MCTLVVADGLGNESVSAEFKFTIVANLRAEKSDFKNRQKALALSQS